MSKILAVYEWCANVYEFANISNVKRNLPMEGLRGLAVILVFFVHYHSLFGIRIRPDSFTFALSTFLWNMGHSGVDLFFVLSGYLIYRAIIRKNINYGAFIKRRIERIYPTFLSVLAIYLTLSFLLPSENKIPEDTVNAGIYILQNILLMPGLFDIQPIITVAWSLSYEFFYYLLIPLLVWALRMRRWSSSFRLSFFIMLLLLYTFFSFFRNTPHFQLVMFIAGILIYEITTSYSPSLNISPHIDYLALFVLMIAFPLIFVLTDSSGLIAFAVPTYGYSYRVIVLFASFFLFVIVCFRSRGLLRNIFSWTPLRWLGNMSYSYYLIHGLTLKGINLCIIWFFASNKDSIVVFWIVLPICFSLTLVSSTALFLLIEKPFSFKAPS